MNIWRDEEKERRNEKDHEKGRKREKEREKSEDD